MEMNSSNKQGCINLYYSSAEMERYKQSREKPILSVFSRNNGK